MSLESSLIAGYPNNTLLWSQAISGVTTGFSSLINAYSKSWLDKSDARLEAMQLSTQIRRRAAAMASNTAAVLSVASIDISKGTPRAIIDQSISEANKEISRITRGIL